MPKRRISIVLLSLSKAGRVLAFQTVVLWLINAPLLESCLCLGPSVCPSCCIYVYPSNGSKLPLRFRAVLCVEQMELVLAPETLQLAGEEGI